MFNKPAPLRKDAPSRVPSNGLYSVPRAPSLIR